MAVSIEQLTAGQPIGTEEQDWGQHRLRLNAYAGALEVPEALVTSVRGVVVRHAQVLLMKAPDGYHIMPGGRREAGEDYVGTVRREVREESGWMVDVGERLGVLHFHHLTPRPAGHSYPYPDFLQLVYACAALRKIGDGDGEWDVPVGFTSIDELAQRDIGPVQMWFARSLLEGP